MRESYKYDHLRNTITERYDHLGKTTLGNTTITLGSPDHPEKKNDDHLLLSGYDHFDLRSLGRTETTAAAKRVTTYKRGRNNQGGRT